MHCTWFNENKNKTKKKVHFPHIHFLWVFPLLTSHIPGALVAPRPPLPTRSPPPLPGPSWPAASDLARAAPADPAPSRGPRRPWPRWSIVVDGRGARGRPGRYPFRSALGSDPV